MSIRVGDVVAGRRQETRPGRDGYFPQPAGALWLSARGWPNWTVVWIFVLGTVLMRSAGCALNDYADRDFDRHVARTRDRPLAAGLISPKEALAVAAVLAAAAFVLVLRLNRLTVMLSFVAVFLAATYPFTKRFFALPQAYLGVAFGFGIPMAFAAQTGPNAHVHCHQHPPSQHGFHSRTRIESGRSAGLGKGENLWIAIFHTCERFNYR